MDAARFHLKDMLAEHHETIFRHLFRVSVLEMLAGNILAAEINNEYMEVIYSAGKISNMRRLEIEIEVTCTIAVATTRVHIEKAAA